MGTEGIEKAVDVLIVLGIAVFVLNILLTLNYSSFAQTSNTLSIISCNANALAVGRCTTNAINGVYANYTTYAGNINNTFSSNLVLAIVALVLISIIVAVLLGIRSTGAGSQGGMLR